MKLQCPKCNSINTTVYKTVNKNTSIIRYHLCKECKCKFSSAQTYENNLQLLQELKWMLRNIN